MKVVRHLASALLIGLGLMLQMSIVSAQPTVQTIPTPLFGYISALAPDGKTLAIAASAPIYANILTPDLMPIHLIDLASGKETGTLTDSLTDFTQSMVFAPDGKTLITFEQNGQMLIWNLQKGAVSATYTMPALRLTAAQFLPDGKHIAAIASGPLAYILFVDTTNGAISSVFSTPIRSVSDYIKSATDLASQGKFSFSALAVAPDGKHFATANLNDEIDLWTIADHSQVMLAPEASKPFQIDIHTLAYSPDGKTLLASNRSDKKLYGYDLTSPSKAPVTIDGGQSFSISPHGDWVAWIDKSAVYLCDFKASQPTKIGDLAASFNTTLAVTYSTPDGKTVIVANLFNSGGVNTIALIPVPAAS